MIGPRAARAAIALGFLAAAGSFAGRASAEGIPQPVELPQQLSLDQSVQILRSKSLDLLMAEASVHSAEGDVGIAGAVPNPQVSIGYGRVFTYDPNGPNNACSAQGVSITCDNNYYQASVSDQAAIEDSLAGKRDLRLKVANRALAAAKMSRNDALRTIEFQVKSVYAQVAQAQRALVFAKDVQTTNVKTLELFQARLRSGAINEGELARVETQKLEADQAVDQALENQRQARVALAFLLGVRGPVNDFSVDDHVLDFAVPPQIANADEDRLLRLAFDHRPDLLAQGYQRASAEAAIALARRLRFPDIALGVSYVQSGTGGAGANGPLQPPLLTFSLTAALPAFYQQQGEIRKAEANYDAQSLQQAKTTAQVVADVSAALSAYVTTRSQVERMEKQLRPAAERAVQITRLQFDKGAATLMDLLDAQRTYIAVNVEYLQELASYWTAVFQLEEAVGMGLRQ
jgi:cobalt-zinc-cadmium efflux system outer membrane protein